MFAFGIDYRADRGSLKICTNGRDRAVIKNDGAVFNDLSVSDVGGCTNYRNLFGLRWGRGLLCIQ